ncbi:MAG: TSUP family transporter, partial [Gammaproteobacteria bacterium]|nr:TSUP family transporter [Gammaproteobacteria bacterium]
GGVNSYEAEVLKQLPEHNLVLLKLVTNDTFPSVVLSDVPVVSTNDIYALGYTENGKFIMQSGQNSKNKTQLTVEKQTLNHVIQTTAVFTWEQNGGPMVNDKGRLLGINLAVKDSGGSLHGLMIPLKVVKNHIRDVVPISKKPNVVNKIDQTQLQNQAASNSATTNALNSPQTMIDQQPESLAVAWWVKARQQVAMANNQPMQNSLNPSMMQNVAFADPQHSPTRALSFLDVGNQHPLKFGAYELNDLLAMMILGIIAGMMGVVMPLMGGVFVIVAMYDVMNYDFYLARPVIYFSMFFIYMVIVIRYRLSKTADQLFSEHPIIMQLPWIILGTILGFLLGNLILDRYIITLLSILVMFLLINTFKANIIENWIIRHLDSIGIKDRAHDPRISDEHLEKKDAYTLLTEKDHLKPDHNQWLHRILAAFPVAFSSGLFAIYTGAISLQAHVNGLSEEKARANSAQLIMFASLTGVIISTLHGMENELFKPETPLLLAMILIPATFGGVFVANEVLKYVKREHLKITLGVILFFSTIFMLAAAYNETII